MILPILWKNGRLDVLDQRKLPHRRAYIRCRTVEQLAVAIERLAIRGAPLIGIAAAYGLALSIWRSPSGRETKDFEKARGRLARTRPTAVNLFWALERMAKKYYSLSPADPGPRRRALLQEARDIHRQDAEICQRIGQYGARLLPRGCSVLTHCNTGALATGGIGTALGIITTAYGQGRVSVVYVDETRPLLQGSRLTYWELRQQRIPAILICDNMAASLMDRKKVEAVMVGADRIADNGDFANKIGTYSLAVLAAYHGIPFYVAAPTSTIDVRIKDRSAIPIEQRDAEEVLGLQQCRAAMRKAQAYNPAFDTTPAELVTAIITEKGVVRPPYGSLRNRLSL